MSQFVLISLREMPIHLAERDEYFRAETLPNIQVKATHAEFGKMFLAAEKTMKSYMGLK